MSLLRERMHQLNRILAGVKAHTDEPDEVLIDRHMLYVNVPRAMRCLVSTHFEAITVYLSSVCAAESEMLTQRKLA